MLPCWPGCTVSCCLSCPNAPMETFEVLRAWPPTVQQERQVRKCRQQAGTIRRHWSKGWLLCCCSIGGKANSFAIFCALHTTSRTVLLPRHTAGVSAVPPHAACCIAPQNQLGSGKELTQSIQSRLSTPLLSVHSSSNKPTLMRWSSSNFQQQCPTCAAQNTEMYYLQV